nr:pentatricopeptide repeat-containing protein At3g58590 [Ipomoea batatas]
MRNPISLASITANLSTIKTHFYFTPKFHLSTSIENCISHGENVKHLEGTQLLQEPSTWVQIHSLCRTKSLHALTIKVGSTPTQPIFPFNNILSKYVLFGNVHVARELFEEMPFRNVVSFNTMIAAYCRDGNVQEAWGLFSEMRRCGFKPTQFTFGGLLSSEFMDHYQVVQLHALIEKTSLLHTDATVGTALLGMLGRCGCLHEACQIFDSMPEKNLVTWNSMILLLGQHGFVETSMTMFVEILRSGMDLSEYTFVGLLSGCLGIHDMELGEQVHTVAVKYGLDNAVSVKNSLVNMYAKCSGAHTANKMFEEAAIKDIVSWNIMIGALAKSDTPDKALTVFLEMYANGFSPNEITFISALNSCPRLQNLSCGEALHAQIIKKKLENDVYMGSALMDFYVKFDKLEEAHCCFNEMCEKSLVPWNTLMLGYSNRGSPESILLLREMIRLGFYPNGFSFSIVIKASSAVELLQLHSWLVKTGYLEHSYVSSSLISRYAKNGLISDALRFTDVNDMQLDVASTNVIAGIYNRIGEYNKTLELFSILEDPNTRSWNILILACSRNSDHKEAFEIFGHMRRARVSPDNYTYVSLLSSCNRLCNLGLGSSLHGLLIKNDFSSCDTFVCNIMIDMYAKCGSLESATKVFNDTTERNVISWTAMISSLGLHGYAHEAIRKFEEMTGEGIKPDKVAFMAVLSACRHVGLVEQGMALFGEMKGKYGFEPEMDHYLIVVDLLSRYGHLAEAEQFIGRMPFPPNASIWRTFLDGCKRKITNV